MASGKAPQHRRRMDSRSLVAKVRFSAAGLLAAALVLPVWPTAAAPAEVVRIAGKIACGQARTCLSPRRAWPQITSATLTPATGGVYRLVMDEKGAELAVVMNQRCAEVLGTVAEQGGERRLTVLGYADPRLDAAHEYWRRYCCNDCAVSMALINARRPRNLRGAQDVAGRLYPYRRKIVAWSRDDENLWVATDNEVVQISLALKAVVRKHPELGLGGDGIRQIASDGARLWLAGRNNLTAWFTGDWMPAGRGYQQDFVKLFRRQGKVWGMADNGVHEPSSSGELPRQLPPLPTGSRMRTMVADGIWAPWWERATRHFVEGSVWVDSRLYATSFGDLYELAEGKWNRIAGDAWNLAADGSHVWFVGAGGVVEYDPVTGRQRVHVPPRLGEGRCSQFLLTRAAAWVAVEPAAGGERRGGGLARLDLASGEWRVWADINGQPAGRVSVLKEEGGTVRAVTASGRSPTESADPGMMHVRRETFVATNFCLHSFDERGREWTSVAVETPALETRLICGHDGSGATAPIRPQDVRDICVAGDRIFASVRLRPDGFFSGYWPTVCQIASRAGPAAPWIARWEHHPEELNLQGEQPEALNISNGGRRVVAALGHDEPLGLFNCDGQAWAITEGCVGWFDAAAGRWVKAYEPGFNLYWRATAAIEDAGERPALFVGSDRGVICRSDINAGQFELQVALKDRSIDRFFRDAQGRIVATSQPAPLGRLPVQLRDKLKIMDCDAVAWDGREWRALSGAVATPPAAEPRWFFKPVEKRSVRDKSQGNFLWGPMPGKEEPAPRYYLKEAFFPEVLCEGLGHRLYIATFAGLVVLQLPEATP